MTQSSLNFSEIESPADLAKANEDVKTPLQAAIESTFPLGFRESMYLVMFLLNNAREFHADFAEDKAEGRKQISAWIYDEAVIASAMKLLSGIDIGQNDSDDDDDETEAETEA